MDPLFQTLTCSILQVALTNQIGAILAVYYWTTVIRIVTYCSPIHCAKENSDFPNGWSKSDDSEHNRLSSFLNNWIYHRIELNHYI